MALGLFSANPENHEASCIISIMGKETTRDSHFVVATWPAVYFTHFLILFWVCSIWNILLSESAVSTQYPSSSHPFIEHKKIQRLEMRQNICTLVWKINAHPPSWQSPDKKKGYSLDGAGTNTCYHQSSYQISISLSTYMRSGTAIRIEYLWAAESSVAVGLCSTSICSCMKQHITHFWILQARNQPLPNAWSKWEQTFASNRQSLIPQQMNLISPVLPYPIMNAWELNS